VNTPSGDQNEITSAELSLISLGVVILTAVAVWPFVGSGVALAFLGLSAVVIAIMVLLRGA